MNKRSNRSAFSIGTFILALAAFINSLLPNSPIATAAANLQQSNDVPAVVTPVNQPVLDVVAAQPDLSLAGNVVASTVPQMIGYQGVLRDGEGKLLTKPVTVTFRIYDNITATSPANLNECKAANPCLWAEVHGNVTVRDGRFSVLLGNVSNPITPTLMTSPDRFIGVQVEGYQEMRPLQRFSSVPFAMWSEKADHADHVNALSAPDRNPMNALVVNNDGRILIPGMIEESDQSEGSMVIGPNRLRIGYSNNYSWMQSHSSQPLYINPGGNNVIINERAGNVGIGTASPERRLHVAGDARVDGWFYLNGSDFIMNAPSRGDAGRALVHDDGDKLIINYGNDFAGGVQIGGPTLTLWGETSVNNKLSIWGNPLVRLYRFTNMGNDGRRAVGVWSGDHHCVASGWRASYNHRADTGYDAVTTYVGSDGWWYVQTQFHSEGPDENPTVDVICFRVEVAEWFGPKD